MPQLSVRASVCQRSATGEIEVHHVVTGRLDCAGEHPAVCAALVLAVASVPRNGLAPETVARLAACLEGAWTASERGALPGIDVAHELSDGHFEVLCGTLSYATAAGRLPVPLPCATVALRAGAAGSFDMHVYGCPRDRRVADAELFLAPFCYTVRAELGARLLAQPLCDAPRAMPRHAPHRSKRVEAKTRHALTLRSLCLHEPALPSALEVLPDGALVCSSAFAGRDLSVVTCHVPSV